MSGTPLTHKLQNRRGGRVTEPVLEAEACLLSMAHSGYLHAVQGLGVGKGAWIQSTQCHRGHSPLGPSLWHWPTCQQVLFPRALLSLVACYRLASTQAEPVPECQLKWSFVGVWPWVLLLQQSYSLLEHPHLSLMSLHHGHHLRLQLLQFVLMLLLCFLIGSH